MIHFYVILQIENDLRSEGRSVVAWSRRRNQKEGKEHYKGAQTTLRSDGQYHYL